MIAVLPTTLPALLPATAPATLPTALPSAPPMALPLRAGTLPMAELIDLYMAHYAGRDGTRTQRLGWWRQRLGELPMETVTDDHIHASLELLAADPARRWAGRDANGQPIWKARKRPMSGATVNRYAAALAAVFTWAIRRRVAPKGFDHPCRRVERQPESDGKTRFLSDEERTRLLEACKASKWSRLYMLVLMALTTGARKSELIGIKWADVDLVRAVVHVGRTKNGDPKCLPLVPAVVEQLRGFDRNTPTAFVFASQRTTSKPYAFEGRWKEAMKVARLRGFRFHDLRHSCASLLAQNGATLLEIGDLLGHRQIAMTRRYSHLADSHRSALVHRVMGDLR